MSFNGNGVFNIDTAGQPVVTGTVISSTAFNALTDDLATGLSTTITKDGQTTPTADIPLGGFKLTGLGDATTADDAIRFDGAGGTPSSLALANATGLPVAGGGTGADTLAANAVLLGNGTSALQTVAPSTSGNVLTSNGSTWTSAAPAAAGATLEDNIFTGLQTFAAGSNIASDTAVNLTTATGNTVVITGTTTSTSLTMNTGQQMILLPSGAWPLTYNATTMNINGGQDYTTKAGDRLYCVKDLAGVIRVSVIKQDAFSATGGTITTSGAYTIHTFTSSGTFTPNKSGTVDYLVVAGGAGGGYSRGGGGGAGGFRTAAGFSVTATGLTVTIGASGAAGVTGARGVNGSDSVFSSITSTGGGGGATNNSTTPGNGGSGGGGHANATTLKGTGTVGQGNDGSIGTDSVEAAGAGGGAGAVGGASSPGVSGTGGAGTANSYSGSSVTYAGGGGGGNDTALTAGGGGSGGGGAGSSTTVGTAGTTNTGGGGGGGKDASNGGAGGSGIVIIRYLT